MSGPEPIDLVADQKLYPDNNLQSKEATMLFKDEVIVLEFDSFMPFKEKTKWKKKITDNGGIISYIVGKNVSFVIIFNKILEKDTFKVRQARRLNIPVLGPKFVEDCLLQHELIQKEPYIVGESGIKNKFKSGKISGGKLLKKKRKRCQVNLNSVKSWLASEDPTLLNDKIYEIAKWAVLKSDTNIQVLEVHTVMAGQQKYRLYSESGQLDNKHNLSCTDTAVVWYFDISEEVLRAYEQLYKNYTSFPFNLQPWSQPLFSSNQIGSNKLKLLLGELCVMTREITPEIGRVIEVIWKEATHEAENNLSIPTQHIKHSQLEEAEAALLQLKKSLCSGEDVTLQRKYQDEFYQAVPHKIKSDLILREITVKQDLCQLIHDIHGASEATDWSTDATTYAKYRALKCHVTHLTQSADEFEKIRNMVEATSTDVQISNVYTVRRTVEEIQFNLCGIENVQLLMHSSPAHNFLGILSRGLLLPNVVVDQFGVSQTDDGMLGSGIYFSNSLSISNLYSKPSTETGCRYLLLCDVALGKSCKLLNPDPSLKAPPDGYSSVHRILSNEDENSKVEYAIYNTNQHRLRYLVEYALPTDVVMPLDNCIMSLDKEEETLQKTLSKTDINDVKDTKQQIVEVKAGLIGGEKKSSVPLRSVHIRAKLLDLVGQVVVLQSYRNDNNCNIEAKYVFPLDDTAAVCGFEAFINGKHIIGEVKEKTKAHKEYKEAISKGHGAYLMDEEEPDVFTVSVGNLPPRADVLIKITYITELQVDGDNISFTIPSSVAPWVRDTALAQQTQDDVQTFKVQHSNRCDISLQVAIEMPFDIRKISSPTHVLKYKKTASKAVVELPKNSLLDEGFQLLIMLSEIHVPRMWVERHPDKDSQACMLSFYPEFEAATDEEPEIVFLLDMSNSMAGKAVLDAKKVLLLAIDKLTEKAEFNIVVFGTSFQELFPAPQRKTKLNEEKANMFIQKASPNMGCSNSCYPLQSLFLLSPPDGSRSIFLISDGYLNNKDAMIRSVRQHGCKNRLFVLGVGLPVNQHLLHSLASFGGGTYEYYNYKTRSTWESKVKSQVEKACQPGISGVEVKWQQHMDNIAKPIQAPAHLPSLFSGSRQVVYGFVPNCTQAELRALVDGKEFNTTVATTELHITTGKMLHQLTARAVIRDYEHGILDDDSVQQRIMKIKQKQYIINLSTQYSIVTPYTSFVAIEERSEGEEKVEGPSIDDLVAMETVDILHYVGWQNPDIFDEKEPSVVIEELLKKGAIAESFSQMEAERCYASVLEFKEELNKDENIDLKDRVCDSVRRFCEQNGSERAKEMWSYFKDVFRKKVNLVVKTLSGKEIHVKIKENLTVKDLRKKLQELEGYDEFRLIEGSSGELKDDILIEDIDLDSKIFVVQRLRGGGDALQQQQQQQQSASKHQQRLTLQQQQQLASQQQQQLASQQQQQLALQQQQQLALQQQQELASQQQQRLASQQQQQLVSQQQEQIESSMLECLEDKLETEQAPVSLTKDVTMLKKSRKKQLATKAARKSAPCAEPVRAPSSSSDMSESGMVEMPVSPLFSPASPSFVVAEDEEVQITSARKRQPVSKAGMMPAASKSIATKAARKSAPHAEPISPPSTSSDISESESEASISPLFSPASPSFDVERIEIFQTRCARKRQPDSKAGMMQTRKRAPCAERIALPSDIYSTPSGTSESDSEAPISPLFSPASPSFFLNEAEVEEASFLLDGNEDKKAGVIFPPKTQFGGKAPRKQIATKAARCVPDDDDVDDDDDGDDDDEEEEEEEEEEEAAARCVPDDDDDDEGEEEEMEEEEMEEEDEDNGSDEIQQLSVDIQFSKKDSLLLDNRLASPLYGPGSPSYNQGFQMHHLGPPSYREASPLYGPGSPSYVTQTQHKQISSSSLDNTGSAAFSPASSTYSPSPAYNATSPAYSPTSPAYNATSLAYIAISPAYNATSPAYSPTSAAYSPTSPVYSATNLEYSPTSPAYSPALKTIRYDANSQQITANTSENYAPLIVTRKLKPTETVEGRITRSSDEYLKSIDENKANYDPKTRSMSAFLDLDLEPQFNTESLVDQLESMEQAQEEPSIHKRFDEAFVMAMGILDEGSVGTCRVSGREERGGFGGGYNRAKSRGRNGREEWDAFGGSIAERRGSGRRGRGGFRGRSEGGRGIGGGRERIVTRCRESSIEQRKSSSEKSKRKSPVQELDILPRVSQQSRQDRTEKYKPRQKVLESPERFNKFSVSSRSRSRDRDRTFRHRSWSRSRRRSRSRSSSQSRRQSSNRSRRRSRSRSRGFSWDSDISPPRQRKQDRFTENHKQRQIISPERIDVFSVSSRQRSRRISPRHRHKSRSHSPRHSYRRSTKRRDHSPVCQSIQHHYKRSSDEKTRRRSRSRSRDKGSPRKKSSKSKSQGAPISEQTTSVKQHGPEKTSPAKQLVPKEVHIKSAEDSIWHKIKLGNVGALHVHQLPAPVEDKYWELSVELCQELRLSYNRIKNILKEQGLYSLGKTVALAGERMLATLIVLMFHIKENSNFVDWLCQENLQDVSAIVDNKVLRFKGKYGEFVLVLKEMFRDVLTWLLDTNTTYSSLCTDLELGKNTRDFIWKLYMSIL